MLSPLRKKQNKTQNRTVVVASTRQTLTADWLTSLEQEQQKLPVSGKVRLVATRKRHMSVGGALEAQSTFVFLLNVTLTSLNAHIVCVCGAN